MQAVLLTEEQAEVHRAFEVLRPDEREALELFYVEGMSPTQIAEMTGKSTAAVRASLNEALVKVGVALRTLQVDATTYPRECREIYLPRLPAYLNGRLESPELEETLRHLEGCQHCQAAREEMRETERRLRSFVPPVRMPPNLFRRIETALEATRSRDGVAALAIDSAEGRPAAPAASVGSVGSVGARLPLAQLRARLEVQVLESLRRVQMALSSGWGTVAANPGVSGAVAGAVALAVTAAVLVPRGHPPPPGPGGSPSPSPSGSRPSASPSQPVLAASVQASNHAVPGPPPPGPTASGPIAPRPTAAGPRASGSTAPGPTPSQTLAQELLPVPAIPSSNWPQWRHDAAHSGFDPADKVTLTNGRHLTTVWSTLIGPDTPYPQRQDAGMIGSPVFADGFVYAGSADGYVVKLDAATGQKRWEAKLSNYIFSTPAVSRLSNRRSFVYVTSSWSGLIALDDATGHVAWRFHLPGIPENAPPVYASPTVVGDVVYVAAGTGNVYAFDGTRFTPPPAGSPAAAEGTNQPLWTVRPTTNVIRATPSVADSLVYVLDEKNGMYALHTSDGTVAWSRRSDCTSVSATDTPVVAGSRLFWTTNCQPFTHAYVYAADTVTGVAQWTTTVNDRIYGQPYYTSSLAVADNTLYVTATSSLWALDPATGTIRWKSPGTIRDAAGSTMFFTSPAIANGLVFVGLFTSGAESPGGYAVFDATSGALLVGVPDEIQVYSSPTIASGMIFMGNHDVRPGFVVAYR